MWVNPLYEISSRSAALELIRDNALATIVVGEPLRAAHLPVLIAENAEDGTLELIGHVPLIDPLSRALAAGQPALVIFQGAQSYISPDWYSAPGLPTYNFLTVHAEGEAIPMADAGELRSHLIELIRVHEERKNIPGSAWTPGPEAIARMEQLLPLIMGFRIPVREMRGKAKLGQNRGTADQVSVAATLKTSPVDDDRDIATRMAGSARQRMEHPA